MSIGDPSKSHKGGSGIIKIQALSRLHLRSRLEFANITSTILEFFLTKFLKLLLTGVEVQTQGVRSNLYLTVFLTCN